MCMYVCMGGIGRTGIVMVDRARGNEKRGKEGRRSEIKDEDWNE